MNEREVLKLARVALATGETDLRWEATTAIKEVLAQPEWVGLTHEEVDSWELPDCPTVFEFAQFIEAKLKEKNT